MAGDAYLRAVLTLDTNADRAAAAIAEASAGMSRSMTKAQRDIAAILARGEPLKQLNIQLAKELEAVKANEDKKKITAQQAEEVRTKLVADFTAKRKQLEEQAAAAAVQATSAASTKSTVEMQKIGTATVGLQSKIKGLNEPLEGLRAGLNQLGGGAGSAVGQVGALAQGLVGLGGKAGAIGAVVAGVGLVAAKSFEEFQKAEAARLQFEALNQTFGVTRDEVNAIRTAFRGYSEDLDTKTVQSLIAAGKQAGLSTEEMRSLGAEIQRAANLTGKDFKDAAIDAFGRFKKEARESSEALTGLLRSMDQRLAGVTPEDAIADKAVDEAEKRRDTARKELERLRAQQARGLGAFSGTLAQRQEALADIPKTIAEQERILLLAEKDVTEEVQKRTAFREKEAELLRQAALDRELAGLGGGGGGRVGRGGGKRKGPTTDWDAAPGLAWPSEDALRVGAGPQEMDFSEGLAGELGAADAEVEAARKANARKRLEEQFAPAQAGAANLAGEMDDLAAEAEKGAIEGFAKAGVSAAESFITNFKRFQESKDPKDLFKGILGAATGILSLFFPGAGLVGGLIGSILEKGGTPHAVPIPQARSGMTLWPGVNHDARPVIAHTGELIPKASQVAQFPGGYAAADRWARGKDPFPTVAAGPAGVTVVVTPPSDSAAAVQAVVAPGLVRRLDNHQGGELERALVDVTRPRELF